MRSHTIRWSAALAVFATGFLCGSLAQQPAHADWKEYGKEAMKQAAQSNGNLGSVAQLGTAIGDMEQEVNGLQKNIETLKKVRTALGGAAQ